MGGGGVGRPPIVYSSNMNDTVTLGDGVTDEEEGIPVGEVSAPPMVNSSTVNETVTTLVEVLEEDNGDDDGVRVGEAKDGGLEELPIVNSSQVKKAVTVLVRDMVEVITDEEAPEAPISYSSKRKETVTLS
jgi:hypothetical protein